MAQSKKTVILNRHIVILPKFLSPYKFQKIQ
jgi:hypothetical protein